MKTYRLFLMAAGCIAAASCVKDGIAQEDNTAIMPVIASFEAVREDFNDVKTVLADGNKVEWTAGDKIHVFNGAGEAVAESASESEAFNAEDWRKGFDFVTETGGAKGCFSTTDADFTETGDYIMLYPRSSGNNYYCFQGADGAKKVRFWVSNSQTAVKGSFAPDRAVSVAKATSLDTGSDNPVVFKNILTLLKFTVPAVMDGKILKITVSGNDGEYLGGDIICDYSGDVPATDLWYNVYGDKSKYTEMTLSSGAGMQAGDYYLVIRPVTVSKGLTVTVSASDGKTYSRSSAASFTFSGGIIYDMGEVAGEDGKYDMRGVSSLPYVFSLYGTAGSGNILKYVSAVQGNYDAALKYFDNYYYDKDDTGVVMQCRGAGRTATDARATAFYSNDWGADNIPAKSFVSTESVAAADYVESFYKLAVPLLSELPSDFRVTFGMGIWGGAVRDWLLQYSKDGVAWYDGGAFSSYGTAHYDIYNVDVNVSQFTFSAGDILYLRFIPTGKVKNSDHNQTTTGWGSDVRLWGGIVLNAPYQSTTASPADAVYFEAFDEMDGGVDYLMGGQVNGTEKLGHLANAFGSDIADWTAAQADGLTGSSVAMRPGYVQIGHPDAITNYGSAYANHIGTLETPALNVTGDLKLSFKALVYRSPMYGREGTGKNANDVAGDVASVVVKINSGSFSATESVQEYTFENVSVSSWETKVLTIYGATADTKVTFTSPSDATGYTRWFLDDICITK